MNLLRRKYAIVWLILSIISLNVSNLLLGYLLDVYEENAWYTKWYYWVLGFIFGIFPGIIMFLILNISVSTKVAKKLEISGYDIYCYPYIWSISLIIPVFGWSLFIIILLYLYILTMYNLFKGKAEEFI